MPQEIQARLEKDKDNPKQSRVRIRLPHTTLPIALNVAHHAEKLGLHVYSFWYKSETKDGSVARYLLPIGYDLHSPEVDRLLNYIRSI